MTQPRVMTKIECFDPAGKLHQLDAEPGNSLMETIVKAGVSGILAECGGSCACATCHVYVDPEWMARVGPAGPMEEGMLELTLDPRPNSRLSCQMKITSEWSGLVVRIPFEQT
jgi:2Fe-2S ferredoxin